MDGWDVETRRKGRAGRLAGREGGDCLEPEEDEDEERGEGLLLV